MLCDERKRNAVLAQIVALRDLAAETIVVGGLASAATDLNAGIILFYVTLSLMAGSELGLHQC